MPQNTRSSQSHLGFFVAMLAVAVLAYGAWWTLDRSYFTTQQQQQTAATNPGLPHPPKDKRNSAAPAAPADADRPAAAASEDPR